MTTLHKREAVRQKETIAVVGLGYVGLPLSLLFVQKGFDTIGIDTDLRKIALLNQGISYLPDIASSSIQTALENGSFKAVADYEAIRQADAVIICVPTPLSGSRSPDLSRVEEAVQAISEQIRKGQLIVLESSTSPGTTSRLIRPMLEHSGLTVGKDIFLGYSPERLDPGNQRFGLDEIPKIVSGVSEVCLQRIRHIYGKAFRCIVPVSSTDAAEMTKLLENTYRLINISFANEFAMLCDTMHLNAWEIIEAAETKPFGYHAFYPGPAAGGHCIPVDPLYMQWTAKQNGMESRIIAASDFINNAMPAYIVQRVAALLAPQKPLGQARILVYGAAYKKDIDDVRESAALEIISSFKRLGAEVCYHDPYIPELALGRAKLSSVKLTQERLSETDCVVIATDHSAIPLRLLLDHARVIFDTRNVTKDMAGAARVFRLGGGEAS